MIQAVHLGFPRDLCPCSPRHRSRVRLWGDDLASVRNLGTGAKYSGHTMIYDIVYAYAPRCRTFRTRLVLSQQHYVYTDNISGNRPPVLVVGERPW